jgi:hypothetical protein
VSNSRGPESTNRGYESVVEPLGVCKSDEWDNTGHEESACRGHESTCKDHGSACRGLRILAVRL